MKKADMFTEAMKLCDEHKAPTGLREGLTVLLKPKTAGQHINLDEVTKKDGNGKVTHLLCSVSGHFLPATAEFFYEEGKEGKGIKGVNGVELRRLSRQAESIRKDHKRRTDASEKAIMNDVMVTKTLSVENGQKKIEGIRASKPDFSKMAKTSEELAKQIADAKAAKEAPKAETKS